MKSEKYVIGIDGGGTKTAVAISDLKGNVKNIIKLSSINYKEYGIEACIKILHRGIMQVLSETGIDLMQVISICIGLPGYGENEKLDRKMTDTLDETLSIKKKTYVNDGVIAYYGALNGQAGINVVAGTGSISFGKDTMGNVARCGGWSEQYGDEGSCYWLAKKAMELFCKESDGRIPKGAMLEIVREELKLKNDMEFVTAVEEKYLSNRSDTAGFQVLLKKAADEGDIAAISLYKKAAEELVLLATGLKSILHFTGPNIPVSLTGGILHTGDLILMPFIDGLKNNGFTYYPCAKSPVEGAVMLAVNLSQ